MNSIKNESEILSHFYLQEDVISIQEYGSGHINTTFLITTKNYRHLILQKINNIIFPNIEGLMNNVVSIIDFLTKKIILRNGDPKRETLVLISTKEGNKYYTDDNGQYWRLFLFTENTICLDSIENEDDFVKVAESFGSFLNDLSDFPVDELIEIIPHFHDTPKRLEDLKRAIKEDKMGRADSCKAEIDFVLNREKDCSYLVDLQKKHILPLRVTHNDTKLNNILLDKDSKKGICVIDLDTVMPGLCAYDFGDSIRFGANDCLEDEQDLSKVNFSLPLYKAFTKGYLNACGHILTKEEKESLPYGARIITLECGIRFLTDYLNGDVYFKVSKEKQNLDRCRTQFKLVSDMEKVFLEMLETVVKS